jgi:beta-glucosidase
MTPGEKIDYLGGDRSMYIRGVPRLGIPEIKMSDGPAGCRNWGPSTAYVAPVGLAAAFDERLAERVGASIGRDCRARNVHILLAPGMNIARTPLGGRNFEYLGEDPFLAGTTAAAYIRGVQSAGVLATAKHFVANDQEWDRTHISSEVDQRTLHEIYLFPFERAVKQGQVASVMTAYNLLNGTYCSHSKYLIRDVLEKDWGFSGFVMSDWHAAQDTMGAIEGGLDLEMPSGKFINRDSVEPLLKAGKIDAAAIDARIRRILLTLARAGFLDHPQTSDAPLDDPRSAEVALDEARRSLVLLKNSKDLLPLDRKAIKRIAVIGPNADPAVVGGYGSAWVTPFHAVSVLAGIKQAAPSASVDYHVGVHQTSEYALLGRPVFDGPVEQAVFRGRELEGAPISTTQVDRIDYRPEGDHPKPPVAGAPSENFSVRWKGQVTMSAAGPYRFATNIRDQYRRRRARIRRWQKGHRRLVDPRHQDQRRQPAPHARQARCRGRVLSGNGRGGRTVRDGAGRPEQGPRGGRGGDRAGSSRRRRCRGAWLQSGQGNEQRQHGLPRPVAAFLGQGEGPRRGGGQ